MKEEIRIKWGKVFNTAINVLVVLVVGIFIGYAINLPMSRSGAIHTLSANGQIEIADGTLWYYPQDLVTGDQFEALATLTEVYDDVIMIRQ